MLVEILASVCFTNVFVSVLSLTVDGDLSAKNARVKSLKDYASDRTFSVADYSNSMNAIVRQLRETFGQDGAKYDQADFAAAGYQQPQHQRVKTVVITKQIPQPYKVEVEKRIPYYLKVPVEKPYPVIVPKPYTVTVEKPYRYPVKVFVPQPFAVEKEVPVPVKVPVEKQVPYIVPKPYPVYKEKIINYAVENPILYPVKVPYERPYAVHVPVEKKVPYTVEKEVPYPVYVTQDRPIPVPVEKPYPVQYEKSVSYPVEKAIPIAVPIPIRIPVEIPIPIHITKHEPIFIPVHEPSEDQDYNGQNNAQTFTIPSFTIQNTAHDSASLENNPTSAINVQFSENYAQSTISTSSVVPDSSYEGSANIAHSVPAPTTSEDLEEENAITDLPSTSTSQSNFSDSMAENHL